MLWVLLAVPYRSSGEDSSGEEQVQVRVFSYHAHCFDETILGREGIDLSTQGLR